MEHQYKMTLLKAFSICLHRKQKGGKPVVKLRELLIQMALFLICNGLWLQNIFMQVMEVRMVYIIIHLR